MIRKFVTFEDTEESGGGREEVRLYAAIQGGWEWKEVGCERMF